ncbi:MAG: ImmA/IrrE family metallo-endopeptidase [Desulfobacter sp.]|nr:ImmA/IrrE family metallo-endopeptidase [Desulfobacter sp.]
MLDKTFLRSSDPILTARNLINSIYKVSFPIDVEQIALNVGIQEINKVSDENVEGFLVALPDKSAGFINISRQIKENSRIRFTIAHELGHFLITTHNESSYSCSVSDMKNRKNSKPQEVEANKFAAELLMPQKFFVSELKKEPDCMLFENLAFKFGASLQATLIRYSEFTDESIAVVLSENSMVKWCSKSKSFNFEIGTKMPLSEETYAKDFFDGHELSKIFEDVDINAWFDTINIKHKIKVKELCFPSPEYNQALSVIWVIEDEDEIEASEDEFDGYLKLKKSW